MLRRLLKFIIRPIAEPGIEIAYRTCVAQARQSAFYAELHAPDTVDGRFDVLILHVLLVILHLAQHSQQTQQLFDILFADMDKNLREMGVSDMRISKKMKPLLAAFYGRAKIYEQALAGNDTELAEALRRNIYGDSAASAEDIGRLVNYIRRAHAALAAQTDETLLAGTLAFPTVI